MTKKMKVIGIVCGVCAALGYAGYFAYETIQDYVNDKIYESNVDGYLAGYKRGEIIGKTYALEDALIKKYITNDQFNELMNLS